MRDALSARGRIRALSGRLNEPVIPEERIRDWLRQFPARDRPAALLLLEKITFHTYPRLVCETRQLHAILKERLEADGFSIADPGTVDFSRGFTCKSGDIISYIYRRANAIPSVSFKNFDRLCRESEGWTGEFQDRALIILDDYIGTGSQFLFQFLARNPEDIRVLKSYRKVYLAAVVMNTNAFEKLSMLKNGEARRVLAIEEGHFPDYDWDADECDLRTAIAGMDWSGIEFVCLEREHALLSPDNKGTTESERALIGRFLTKYGEDSTYTTSFLEGHHTFFYGAPNSLPKILFPLFSRVEDCSIYPMEHFLVEVPAVTCWDQDQRVVHADPASPPACSRRQHRRG